MIFVTVGTLHFPFKRLLSALDGLPGDETIVVQAQESQRAGAIAKMPYDELALLMREARVVVCHAGVGSVLTALTNGKRPIAVPRLVRHGEAVDDHQLYFGRRLAAAGLVRLVEDPATELVAAIAEPSLAAAPLALEANALADDLRATLEELVGYSR